MHSLDYFISMNYILPTLTVRRKGVKTLMSE